MYSPVELKRSNQDLAVLLYLEDLRFSNCLVHNDRSNDVYCRCHDPKHYCPEKTESIGTGTGALVQERSLPAHAAGGTTPGY